MRVNELDHEEQLGLDPEGGIIRFAGQSALLLDAVAMGLLRKQLVESIGLIAVRAKLTEFGFADRWRMAGAMKAEIRWDTLDDWRAAWVRIHALEGPFLIHAVCADPQSRVGATLADSYEADSDA